MLLKRVPLTKTFLESNKYIKYMQMDKKFRDYKDEGANWITLANGEFYPDILLDACQLYRPVLEIFGQLLKSSESSQRLFIRQKEIKKLGLKIKLAGVFRKKFSRKKDYKKF